MRTAQVNTTKQTAKKTNQSTAKTSATTNNMVIPKEWDKNAHTLWLQNKKVEAIQAVIATLNTYGTDKPEAILMQASYYLYLIADYQAAAMVLEPVGKTSTNPETILNLAVCCRRCMRYTDAITYANKTLALAPNNMVAYDVLSTSYFELKQYEEASNAGTKALELKDALANTVNTQNWVLPNTTPQAFAADKKQVISFSLWGSNPRYLRGALRNLLIAPDLYPNWTLRFYLDNSVPAEFIALITKLGGEVLLQPEGKPIKERLCWRFLVANDPTVGYFLVRDIDSVFGIREVLAVEEWQRSKHWFHVIRDWWSHTDLMLAGLWGGVANVLPNLINMLASYRPKTMETPNIDQWFLRDQVWAYVRQSVLTHDRCFNMPNTVRLTPPPNDIHIGQNEAVLAIQSKVLGAWIDGYTCLQ